MFIASAIFEAKKTSKTMLPAQPGTLSCKFQSALTFCLNALALSQCLPIPCRLSPSPF